MDTRTWTLPDGRHVHITGRTRRRPAGRRFGGWYDVLCLSGGEVMPAAQFWRTARCTQCGKSINGCACPAH